MTKRAQLDYVKLDVDLFDKPRFQYFLSEFGAGGGLYLIRVWAAIARAENALLPRKYALSLGQNFGIDKETASRALDLAAGELLIEAQSDHITLARIGGDQEKVASRREADANYQRQKRESGQSRSRLDADSKHDSSPSPLTYTSSSTSVSKEGGPGGEPPLVFPEKLNSNTCRMMLTKWVEHLAAYTPPKNLPRTSIDALLMSYATRPADFIADIKHSMNNGYRTLCTAPAKPGPAPPPNPGKQPLTPQARRVLSDLGLNRGAGGLTKAGDVLKGLEKKKGE